MAASSIVDPVRLAAVRATGLLDTPAEDPFDELAALAATLLDAPFAFVTLVDDRRSFWKSCIGIDASDPAERQNPVEESFCQYVVASREPLIVGDTARDERTRENPSIASMGVAAWAGFPVFDPDGAVLGSFCVVDTRTRDWTEHDADVLRALSRSVSREIALRAAISRAIEEAERSAALARTLQETLLPPHLPELPGLDVAARYRPAGGGTELVGDFYDLFPGAGDRWWLVMGDVCGKGVEAAKLTALTRYTIRAAAMSESGPSRVLARLNEALLRQRSDDGLFVTATVACLRRGPTGASITLSGGGHPPSLALRADGVVQGIDPTGRLLGVTREVHLADRELDLGPGDALVLYTDGITEARREGVILGEEGLRRALERAAGLDARGIADAVDQAALAAGAEPAGDDAAVLVVRVPPTV